MMTKQNVKASLERVGKRVGIVATAAAIFIPIPSRALPVPTGSGGPSITIDSVSVSSYLRYTALSCSPISSRLLATADGAQRLTWRSRWPDTIATANAPDSLAKKASLRAIGAELLRCLSAETPEQVPPGHLISAGMAWLTATDDAKASAAFARAVKNVENKPLAKRALVLGQIIEAYLTADSNHVASALSYMAQLDALGSAVAGRRLAMRNMLYRFAQWRDSVALMEGQVQAASRAYAEITGDGRLEWFDALIDAVINHANLLQRQGRYARAVEILEKGKQELQVVQPGKMGQLDLAINTAKLYGAPAKPIQASWVYWPGKTTPDSAIKRPVPGRFSLYVFFAHNMGLSDIRNFKIVQRLAAKYGNRIDVTILDETTGFDALRQSIVKPVDEAKDIAAFYHDYLTIPVPVAIFDRPVTGKRPDGAIELGPNPNYLPAIKMLLIDPQGKICYPLDWFNHDFGEGRIRDIVENWTPSARL